MKLYIGQRHPCPGETTTNTSSNATFYIFEDGKLSVLNPRRDIHDHSPTGMMWGYHGSGPAQLALAILADHFDFGVNRAKEFYQEFMGKVISRVKGDYFVLSSQEIDAALRNIGAI